MDKTETKKMCGTIKLTVYLRLFPFHAMNTQDVWLKMHSAESFTQAQGGADLVQLLTLYRSASLEVIEGMMRHAELEKVADGYTRKKVRGPLQVLVYS